MSQYQKFDSTGTIAPNIEFVAGNTGGPVGPNPATFTINLIGDTAQGVSVAGNAATFTETITVQNATAAATSGAALKGVSSYSSDFFTLTAGFVTLNNALVGTVTTVGAVVGNTITFPLGATPATYQFTVDTVGFEPGLPSGVTAKETVGAYTDGAVATLIDTVDFTTQVGPGLVPALFYSSISGNNLVVTVLGSPGKTVRWRTLVTYNKVT